MPRQLILKDALGQEVGRGDMVRIYADPTEEDPDRQSIAIYPNPLTEQPIIFLTVTGAETVIESDTPDPPGPPPHA